MTAQLEIVSGHPPIYLFKNVFEVIFESGYLIELVDYSERMAEIRDRVIADRIDTASTSCDFSLYDLDRQLLADNFRC